MKTSLMTLLLLFVCTAVFSQAETEAPYKRFPTLPPLKLLLTDSSTQFTENNLIKNVPVFIILFSPDCEHCQKETEELIDNIEKFSGILIVMTTTAPFEKMKEFYNTYRLHRFQNITMGYDQFFLLPTFYRIKNTPFLAFYDKAGKLIDVAPGALPIAKVLEYFKQ